MNKIYGLNIDALRLCYEVTEPNNINVINFISDMDIQDGIRHDNHCEFCC